MNSMDHFGRAGMSSPRNKECCCQSRRRYIEADGHLLHGVAIELAALDSSSVVSA
jgi:hypothetical protein